MQTRSTSKSVADISALGVDRMQRNTRSAHTRNAVSPRATPSADKANVSAQAVQPSSASLKTGLTQRHESNDDSAAILKDFSVCSSSKGEHSNSSHSSATVRAKKLAAEAEHLRRRVQLAQEQAERECEREREQAERQREREREQAERQRERERELARLQLEAEQTELQAQLAALDATDKSARSRGSSRTSRSSEKRTESWVRNHDKFIAEVNVPTGPEYSALDRHSEANTRHILQRCTPPVSMPELPRESVVQVSLPTVTQHNPLGSLLRPAISATHIPTVNVTSFKPFQPTTNAVLPPNDNSTDSISQLTKAIIAASERPKRPELVIFSGDISQWMSFKSSYDKTKYLFSPAENLVRLSNAVRGPAYQAVASHLWDSRDPEDVIRTLEQSFARPEILVAREIGALRNIKLSNAEHLNILANKLRNCVSTIKHLRQYEYLYSPELFRSILLKLSEHTRSRFADYAATRVVSQEDNTPRLQLLSDFLLEEADRQLKFNFISDSITGSSNKLFMPKPIVKEIVHATVAKSDDKGCTYCKQGSHSIGKCKAFQLLNIESRWQWIRQFKICYRCLKSNPHRWNFCRAKPCGNNGCTRRHHSLLHGAVVSSSQADNNVSQGESVVRDTVAMSNSESDIHVPIDQPNIQVTNVSETPVNVTGLPQPQPKALPRGLLKVLPVVLEGPKGQFATSALLDEGSTATLIDGDVAARIGAITTARQSRLRIEGVGGMSKDVDMNYVNFFIRGRNQSKRYLIENARAITPLGLRTQNIGEINYSDFKHLASLSDELSHNNMNPTVLIGASNWDLSLSRDIRVGKKNEPVASRTLLGWVLHGAISTSSKPIDFVNVTYDDTSDTDTQAFMQRQYDELENLIKHQYEIDSLGISKRLPKENAEDQRALDIITKSARRLDTGRFEVRLPWRENIPKPLPDSYTLALSRFLSLERQLARDPVLMTGYEAFITGIIEKGYAEECEIDTYHNSCSSTDGSIRWYLPTFGVMHPQKRKLRVVHDAAAKTKGVCLNSLLLKGPDLLQPLLDILFRFREGAIALNADIREMFPQIKIAAEDRDAQRFLWRSKEGNLTEYRMSSMMFGAISSPFIALALKNKNAEEFKTQFPEACLAIINDHYMDDYLGSHFDVSLASKIASDIVKVHKACCFEMRSWVSNCSEALSQIPVELRSESSSEVNLPPNDSVGVLGVRWNPRKDQLSFRVVQHDSPVSLTKRYILSKVMKIYDPLGLLMPIIIEGRIILQKLWREGLDWDTPIPEKFVSECNNWFNLLGSMANVNISRCYMNQLTFSDVQLHVFADGGEQAYACVAYWRFTYSNNEVSLSLIGSKARVAPLKPISIPRLELQAALIASRFAQAILKAHRIKPSAVFYWSDSTTVLKWLRGDARAFKPFVAHRLGEILETTNPSNWRWVPSALNNADDATKPKALKLDLSHRWFSGPSFLLSPDCDWPTESGGIFEEVAPASDDKSELVGLLVDTPLPNISVPDFTRFSKWLRLLRSTARFLQAARIFRSFLSRPIVQPSYFYADGTTSPSGLTALDISHAEKLLLHRAQVDSFPEEYKSLKSSQPVAKNSRIAALSPVLGPDGFITLDSRITSAPGVSESVKYPLVLDGRHHIVRLIILHHHCQTAHSFNELVLNELRQRYWILKARSTIRSVVNTCNECKRHKVQPVIPQTGNLPSVRLEHHRRPFTNVGLDYFGPIDVTVNRRHEKRYVALYTCLVTRALHLEVVGSLSSDSALLSLRRFIARRGSPSVIMSDNGTNFVGANRILRSLHGDDVREFATNHKIEWRFIPPASPFMGGAWERLVRTVKTALRYTLKTKSPKEEILTTLLAEVEGIVNSRPLTYISSSPQAPEAITPFHFIFGSSSVSPWTSSLTDTDLVRRCDWRQTLRLADHFWSRWLREYLPTLRPRGPRGGNPAISEGDVVLIADASLPRGLWPLGRVLKVFRGADGTVRVADIVTKGGTLRRPVRKLLLLSSVNQPPSNDC